MTLRNKMKRTTKPKSSMKVTITMKESIFPNTDKGSGMRRGLEIRSEIASPGAMQGSNHDDFHGMAWTRSDEGRHQVHESRV